MVLPCGTIGAVEPIACTERHSGSMSCLVRILSLVAPAFLGMSMIAQGQVTGAVTLPKAGVIEVTGYEIVAEAGSRGPVTEAITGPKAKALRSALEHSPPWKKTASLCLDELQPFVIDVVLHRGARPAMVVTAYDTCAGANLAVTIGTKTTYGKDDCALESAVVTALPLGQAQGTRELVSDACATSPTP